MPFLISLLLFNLLLRPIPAHKPKASNEKIVKERKQYHLDFFFQIVDGKIHYHSSLPVNLFILDATNTVKTTDTLPPNGEFYPMPALAAGSYIIKLKSGNEVLYKKIVQK